MAKIPFKAWSSNRLVSSPHYGEILHLYNQEFRKAMEAGKRMNNLQFFRDVVRPRMGEDYSQEAFYQFLRRFKTEAGLRIAHTNKPLAINPNTEQEIIIANQQELLSGDEATRRGIRSALNIGAEAFEQLINHPELLTPEKRAEIFFKAMKAQDSRMAAIGKIREDNRQQAKFEKAFNDASMDEE